MIKLNQYINENLILEAIVSSVEGYKIKFDLGEHAFDRKSDRETKYNEYISNAEILYSLYKVSKNIRDDFDENLDDIMNSINGILNKTGKGFETTEEDEKEKNK